MLFKSFPFIFLCLITQVKSAKILGIFHNPSRSHHILGSTLLEALALRGHEVTMVSPYRSNTTLANYEDIELGGMLKYKEDGMVHKLMKQLDATVYKRLSIIEEHFQQVNTIFLNHPAIRNLLLSHRKYDLVILNWVFNEAFLGFAYHFKAPVVVFSSFGSSSLTNKITGNSAPSSYVPNIIPPLSDDMSFFQRAYNTFAKIVFEFTELYREPVQEKLLQEHFPDSPHIRELVHNVSLVLLNSHFTVESPRPYVPNMIPVGGFHVQEPAEIEGQLKIFMDNAVKGVVYFSLGANVESAHLDAGKLKAVANTLSKLPLKVLWKFEANHIPELSSNVMVSKWFPQNDILAHPNLKLFVTQGGLLSMTEAIYHGVPMVGIPCFGDQESNVEHGVSNGYAVKVAYHDLTEETLSSAINEVLHNLKYKNNVRQRSLWVKDRIVKPLDVALYWIEYVLKYGGAHHLKTKAVTLYWYQYYLLDVIAFILIILLTIYVIIKTLAKVLNMMVSKKPKVGQKKFL